MILFKEKASSLSALFTDFFGYGQAGGPACAMWFMEGPMPSSIEDIPFDITNPLELSANARGTSYMYVSRNVDTLQIEGTGPRNEGSVPAISMLKSPYQDNSRNGLYRVFPKWSCHYLRLAEIENEDSTYAKTNGMRYVNSWAYVNNGNPDEFSEGNSELQMYISPGRYHYNYPNILEFDEEVSIKHIAIQQAHAGTIYTNTSFTLAAWDETLNYGEGDWGPSTTVSYSQGNAKNEVTLDTAVVGKRFRLGGADTGTYNWLCKYMAFYSDTVPTALNESVTLGWCLITPYWYGAFNLRSGNDWDSNLTRGLTHPRTDVMPVLMCSVGDAQRAGTVTLANATDLVGPTDLEFTAFALTYGDSQ